MQRMIYQQTGAWVRVSPEKLVLLHGSPQERKLGHAFIKYILVTILFPSVNIFSKNSM